MMENSTLAKMEPADNADIYFAQQQQQTLNNDSALQQMETTQDPQGIIDPQVLHCQQQQYMELQPQHIPFVEQVNSNMMMSPAGSASPSVNYFMVAQPSAMDSGLDYRSVT